MLSLALSFGFWDWFILAAVLLLLEVMAPGTFMLWLGLAAILAGCGQVAPPQVATPVHFTVLTKQGALERGIFAATNVDGLRSQETPIGPKPFKTCATADERGCFATFTTPPGSLLVAMQPMGCADNHLDTAYLKKGALTFVINWTNTCPPGEMTVM